jgi:phytanoyl-CoA hydroxylase
MLTKTQVEEYRNEGFTIARGVFSAAEISAIREACDELWDFARRFSQDEFVGVSYFNLLRDCDPFAKNISDIPQIHGMVRRVTYPYGVSKVLNDYRTHAGLLSCVSSMLGNDIVQIVNQVNFNSPSVGTGWGWHQDYRFRKTGLKDVLQSFVQCLLAVDRCSAENGGLRVVPKSFTLGGLALDKDIAHAEEHFDAGKAVTPVLEPGDVIFFNAYVIHGSTPNRSQSQRRVYINGYARQAACEHGMPVLVGGKIVKEISAYMEYEHEQAKLPLAAKY